MSVSSGRIGEMPRLDEDQAPVNAERQVLSIRICTTKSVGRGCRQHPLTIRERLLWPIIAVAMLMAALMLRSERLISAVEKRKCLVSSLL